MPRTCYSTYTHRFHIIYCVQLLTTSTFTQSNYILNALHLQTKPPAPRNPHGREKARTRTRPCAAVHIGLKLSSAVSTSQTTLGSMRTSGFAPPTSMFLRRVLVAGEWSVSSRTCSASSLKSCRSSDTPPRLRRGARAGTRRTRPCACLCRRTR